MGLAGISPVNRAAIVAKAVGILAFVLLTNDVPSLGERIDVLVHNFNGYTGVVIFGGLWLVCLAGVLATGFLSRLWLRVVFGLPLLAGALVGSAYRQIAEAEVTYDSAWIMRQELWQTGSALSFYATPVGMATLLALLGGAALLTPPRHRDPSPPSARMRARHRLGALVPVFLAAAPFALMPAVIVARAGYGTGGLPVQYTVPSLFLMVELSAGLSVAGGRKPVELALDGDAGPPPHVVLMIDESVRGDYLDLNVQRGTTPLLLRHRDRIANFGHAVAASNCSAASNLILRTGAMPPDPRDGAHANPYVWDYARRAGMGTSYIYAPVGPGHGNYLLAQEEAQIDALFPQEGEDRLARDLHAVRRLRELLARPEPQFVVVVKSGIHFPFEGRFPAAKAPFRPHLGPGQAITDKTLLENSYKNAVAWTVDQFFERLLSDVTFEDLVLLYTADHGQNLLDNGSVLTHCSVENTSPYEGLVPMFAITGLPEWRDRFGEAAARNLNRTSHFNLFATLLVLFGYSRDQVAERFEPSLLEPIETEYRFLSGVVTPSPPFLIGSRIPLSMHRIPREILDQGGRAP